MTRIRNGNRYVLRPVGLDSRDPRVTAWANYLVRVIQPRSCPRNGTMGHCYVESLSGEFIGLVLVASLQPLEARKSSR